MSHKKDKQLTAFQDKRIKQIEALRSNVDKLSEIERETTFETPITKECKLIIRLQPTFPDTPPILEVFPPVAHSMVNHDMRIFGVKKLTEWSSSTNVGKLVKEILKDLKGSPPRLLPPVQRPASSPPAGQQPQMQRPVASSPPPAAAPAPGPDPRNARVVNGLPQLQNMSNDQLEKLLNDDQAMLAFVATIQNDDMEKKNKDLKETNTRIAAENLGREDELVRLKVKLNDQQDLLKAIEAACQETREKYNAAKQRFAPEVVVQALRQQSNRLDEESEQIGDQFTSGQVDVEEFIKSYVTVRKQYHLCASKMERFVAEQGKT